MGDRQTFVRLKASGNAPTVANSIKGMAMRHLCRRAAWICLATVPLGLAVLAQGSPTRPQLDGMAAMQAALAALRPDVGDGMVSAVSFDPSSGVWHFRLDRDPSKTPASIEVTLDETSGAVCARDPAASGDCIARGSVAAQLKEARTRRAAQEEAAAHPAPDLQGVMIALVRYQTTAKDGYIHGGRMPLYVSMYWPDHVRRLDLSPDAIQRLADIGLRILPGSAWPSGKAPPEARMMSMGVGLPLRRRTVTTTCSTGSRVAACAAPRIPRCSGTMRAAGRCCFPAWMRLTDEREAWLPVMASPVTACAPSGAGPVSRQPPLSGLTAAFPSGRAWLKRLRDWATNK